MLFFYAPLLAGLRSFPDGDFTHHFLPFSLFQHQALRDLRLPLWNPHTYAGHPFLADTQAAVFYPLSNLLLLLTLPFDGAAARMYLLQLEAVLQTALAGAFVALLLHELVRVRWAALLGGLTFALSGYLVAYPPLQLAVLRSALWLPLLLWVLLRMARRPGVGWALAAGAALACAFFAGHPQTFLYVAYVAAAWVLLLAALAARDGGAGALLRFGGGALLACAAAAGLAAVQFLPSWEFTRLSVRADVDYAFVSGGFPLQDSWQLLLPGVFSYYSPLYVGVVGLALSLVAAASLRVRRVGGAPWSGAPWSGAATLFLLGLALFGLLVSFGGNGFLYPIVYRVLPGWGWFRGQERAAYLVALALSLLAGLGAAALPTLRPGARRRLALVAAAVVIGATYAFGLLYQLAGRTVLGNGRYLLIAALTILLAAALALALWLPGWSARRSFLLPAMTVVNLAVFGMGLNQMPGGPAQRTLVAPEVTALQAAVAEAGRTANGLPGRVYNEFRAYEDYALRAGLEDLWGSSPLRLERYAALAQEFPLDRWWRLYGVGHVLTWRRELFVASTRQAEFPQAADSTYLHQLNEPNPRAWVVGGVRAADDTEALALLADHTWDLDASVLLPPETAAGTGTPGQIAATIRMTRARPEALRIVIESPQPGILVLAENWMPGWRVEGAAAAEPVLGLPAYEPLRANRSQIAIPIPAGESDFTLVYAPQSVRRGLWIGGATVAAGLLLLAAQALARRARRL